MTYAWRLFSVLLVAVGWASMASSAPNAGGNGRIALTSGVGGNGEEIYTVQPDGSGLQKLTTNNVVDSDPVYSPDGQSIAFVRVLRPAPEAFNWEIFVMKANGTGARRLTRWRGDDVAPSWSPDGSRIVFLRRTGATEHEGEFSLYTIRLDNGRTSRLATRPASWGSPSWSPDGRSIALTGGSWYGSEEGSGALNTVGAEGRGLRKIVAFNDEESVALRPAWSPSGERIFFIRGETCRLCEGLGDLWTVRSAGGAARFLLDRVDDFAVSPDGTQIVALDGYDGRLRIASPAGRRIRDLDLSIGASRPYGQRGGGLTWQPRCSVAGGVRGDRLRASLSAVLVCGFGGADRIAGGPGRDRLFGGDGDDSIDAGGGGFDVIGCGPGKDAVRADQIDHVGVDCERVTRS